MAMISPDVMATLGTDKPKKETKGEPKRYVMFTLAEWQATINKAFGRDVPASEIKTLLVLMCNGTIEVLSKKAYAELKAKAESFDALEEASTVHEGEIDEKGLGR
jgi:hypothetical protein